MVVQLWRNFLSFSYIGLLSQLHNHNPLHLNFYLQSSIRVNLITSAMGLLFRVSGFYYYFLRSSSELRSNVQASDDLNLDNRVFTRSPERTQSAACTTELCNATLFIVSLSLAFVRYKPTSEHSNLESSSPLARQEKGNRPMASESYNRLSWALSQYLRIYIKRK